MHCMGLKEGEAVFGVCGFGCQRVQTREKQARRGIETKERRGG